MKTLKKWSPLALVTIAAALVFGFGANAARADSDAPTNVEKAAYTLTLDEGRYATTAQLRESGPPWPRAQYGALGYGQFIEFDDDDDLDTSKWTFTVTGDTAPTAAIHAVSGHMLFTSFATDNNTTSAAQDVEWIKFELGRNYIFVFAGTFNQVNANQGDIGFGVGIIDTDWLGDTAIMSDGLFFEVNDGDLALDLISAKNATQVSEYTRQANIFTVVDNVAFTVAMSVYMDPDVAAKGRVIVWVNERLVKDVTLTDIPDDEELGFAIAHQDGDGAANTFATDYIGFAGDRAK